MRPKLTYELANAAAQDAGNRSMRAGFRTAWNKKDYHVCMDEIDRLYDIIEGKS